MKIFIIGLLSLAGLLGSEAAVAQIVYLESLGGVTIKNVIPSENGYVLLTFVETFPQLNSCTSAALGSSVYQPVVWINPASPGAKQLHLTALAASLMGRKIQVAGVQVGNPCFLNSLGLVP